MPKPSKAYAKALIGLRPALQVGNIQLGIPVRVTRRNEEKDALSGYVFIYDGLYDVVS